MKKKKIALALGGGGVRGLAHIGVMEVLIEHGIEPDVIVGTSAGSIIGALYCDNPDIKAVKDKMLHIKRQDVMHFSMLNSVGLLTGAYSPMSLDRLVKFLKSTLSTLEITEFKIKYAAVATDIVHHRPYYFDDGSVIDAILASTALPPIFSPHKFDGMLLIDGGITNPVPVSIAREYDPDIVIAVNINSPGTEAVTRNIFEISMQALYTSYYCLSVEQSKQADFVIHPNLQKYNIFEDRRNQEIYDAGRAEALKVVPSICRALGLPYKH
jgi:NTE family protein